MNTRSFIILLAALLSIGFLVQSSAAADEPKITVLNPRGILPEIQRIPMADRPSTLDGRTVYVVDTKFARTREFMEELTRALNEKYPKTNWILRDKIGNYQVDDPKLWEEIKEKGAGVVMALGH